PGLLRFVCQGPWQPASDESKLLFLPARRHPCDALSARERTTAHTAMTWTDPAIPNTTTLLQLTERSPLQHCERARCCLGNLSDDRALVVRGWKYPHSTAESAAPL